MLLKANYHVTMFGLIVAVRVICLTELVAEVELITVGRFDAITDDYK